MWYWEKIRKVILKNAANMILRKNLWCPKFGFVAHLWWVTISIETSPHYSMKEMMNCIGNTLLNSKAIKFHLRLDWLYTHVNLTIINVCRARDATIWILIPFTISFEKFILNGMIYKINILKMATIKFKPKTARP